MIIFTSNSKNQRFKNYYTNRDRKKANKQD